ncbi:Dabb family protein [Parahaliea aestuarii]|uniref:Dabb family protein n=1 Tax=Parahaliea aestuarii TaxID=1852021 RepID=A0A5C8ZUE6_9GAMM|nr:Dabb family protein [Parahaliea aestuarii]TXS91182.1 Dabb family protein [Parahaliea aestuarii]
MITVQDHLIVPAAHLDAVRRLFAAQYQEGAAARGLVFRSAQVSPPVLTAECPVSLWLQWEVADVGAWWAMRAQSSTPQVLAFWAEIDALVESRERHYLQDCDSRALAPALSAEAPVATHGYRETAQLLAKEGHLDALESVLQDAVAALPGLRASALSRNFAPEYAAGHFTWDLQYTDENAARLARQSDAWQHQIAPALADHCEAVHALAMETVGGGIRDAGMAGGVKRTAFFRVLAGQSDETAARFERDLLAMPLHIGEIRNWRLSRARATDWHQADVAAWTWVWEQEFDSLDGLTGPYMAHSHHWAYIDRWFDPESGAQAIDLHLSHAFCAFADSVLAAELVPEGV